MVDKVGVSFYPTLVTSIWDDKNKNDKVEFWNEITTEEYWDFSPLDNPNLNE